MIRILLADDSPLVKAILKDIFNSTDDIRVVGEATNGKEAVAMTALLKPDLIIMDLMMPVVDGLEAIEEIMADMPIPILVLSTAVNGNDVNRAFSAIKKGALDVMEKPALHVNDSIDCFMEGIAEKVRLLAGIRVIHHPRWKITSEHCPLAIARSSEAIHSILAIGASTGGPKGVMNIVRSLPANFSGAVFIVQHIACGFAEGFAQWLDRESAIPVRLAVDGDGFRTGEALVAPCDSHMILADGKIRLLKDPPVNCCRPSIDIFFNSLAEGQCSHVVSILLSGMGRDGANGLLRIREQGGMTIAQDEKSCAVFGMPKAAIELHAVEEVLPLASIPAAISKLFAT